MDSKLVSNKLDLKPAFWCCSWLVDWLNYLVVSLLTFFVGLLVRLWVGVWDRFLLGILLEIRVRH